MYSFKHLNLISYKITITFFTNKNIIDTKIISTNLI